MSDDKLGTCECQTVHAGWLPHVEYEDCKNWRESAPASQANFGQPRNTSGIPSPAISGVDFGFRGAVAQPEAGEPCHYKCADCKETINYADDGHWYHDKFNPHCLATAQGRWPVPVEAGEPADNPRGFCPECHADLGSFYSNRINWYRGAAPASPLTAEQFYMYKWRDEHANQTINLGLMLRFAEAYAHAVRQEDERDENETLKLLLQEKAEMTAERDALKEQLNASKNTNQGR